MDYHAAYAVNVNKIEKNIYALKRSSYEVVVGLVILLLSGMLVS